MGKVVKLTPYFQNDPSKPSVLEIKLGTTAIHDLCFRKSSAIKASVKLSEPWSNENVWSMIMTSILIVSCTKWHLIATFVTFRDFYTFIL